MPETKQIGTEPRADAPAPVGGTEEQERRRPSWLALLSVKRLSALYLWLFFILLFAIITPDTFLTETTFRLVFRAGVVTCILALAFLVPLTAGAVRPLDRRGDVAGASA